MSKAIDFTLLAAFFPASAIEWRAGSLNYEKTRAQAIPYINARAVQQRLDDVCGAENWENKFKPSPMNNGVICAISIRDEAGNWVSKEDGAQYEPEGADSTSPTMAVKGAYSNALKRAAVMWGIGRYLYSVNHAWVEVDTEGNFTKTPTLPASLLPPNDKSASPAPRLAVVPAAKPVSVESTKTAVSAEPVEKPAVAAATPEPATTAQENVEPAQHLPVETQPTQAEATAKTAEPAPVADSAGVAAGAEVSVPLEMLDALDAGTRNYVQQLVRYIEEGRNLATVHTALTNGRAKERLGASHPAVLERLKSITNTRMQLAAAA